MSGGSVSSPDFETAWQAVLARDRTHDDRFVFAVVTTGIYCRPSCPARRPLRTNVRFFADPEGRRPRASALVCGVGHERPHLIRRAGWRKPPATTSRPIWTRP
jgi:hypothetical protein